MPSQGEGEQSTKFGGPCPYCPHPPALCKFENEFPLGGGFDAGGAGGGEDGGGGEEGGGGVGAGGAAVAACATAICIPFCVDTPLASETVIPKLKFPDTVGVPVTVPVP